MENTSALGANSSGDRYQVVARRYRPQDFEELVGQEHVTKAIKNAISSNRVGHAYLFTGARGVGKTSAARILAKCLNCQTGPTLHPCGQCDICMSIRAGDDVDVLEIDGASNRGIDEIRQLRANVNIRPSRARAKIYIIDEVHMLTKEAFNALLKTLEEPPAHVKFIFCTTDPEKIPITVLSRCQRFDFAPIDTEEILQRLMNIVEREGGSAEREALELLARRAAGSMRDSQSLLEQLLSYGKLPLTADSVHQLLGTARHQQIFDLLTALSEGNASAAIAGLSQALQQGVDVGQFAEQLMLTLRDALVCSVGGGRELLLSDAVANPDGLNAIARSWGTPKILLALQILESFAARMRHSVQRRTLLEMALVQVSHLDDISDLTQTISDLGAAATSEKKNENLAAHRHERAARDEPVTRADQQLPDEIVPQPEAPVVAVSARDLWSQAIARFDGLLAEYATECSAVERPQKDLLVLSFGQGMYAQQCDRPEERSRIERVLGELTGHPVRVQIRVDEPVGAATARAPRLSQRELIRRSYQHAFVQQAIELFDGNVKEVHPQQERVRA